jgi:hypothetical protein
MKQDTLPIPLDHVVLMLPRWLHRACVVTAALSLTIAVVMACCGSAWFGELAPRDRTVGTAVLFADGLALFGVVAGVRWVGRRVRANGLFEFLTGGPRTRQLARAATVLVPCFAVFGVGALLAGHVRLAVVGGFVNAAVFAGMAGFEAVIRHCLRRQAMAIFTLYAEGQLAAGDAAAIDDARSKDARFDAAVHEYQRVVAMVGAIAR